MTRRFWEQIYERNPPSYAAPAPSENPTGKIKQINGPNRTPSHSGTDEVQMAGPVFRFRTRAKNKNKDVRERRTNRLAACAVDADARIRMMPGGMAPWQQLHPSAAKYANFSSSGQPERAGARQYRRRARFVITVATPSYVSLRQVASNKKLPRGCYEKKQKGREGAPC